MKRSIKLYQADYFIALFAITEVFWLLGDWDIVTVPLLALQYVISFYYAFYLLNHCKLNNFLKAMYVLLAMFTVYGVILIISGDTLKVTQHDSHAINNRFYLNLIYKSFLGFFPIYVYARRGLLTKEQMARWVYVFFALAIMVFLKRQAMAMENMAFNNNITDEVVNNASYLMLSLFPALALFGRHKYIQYVGLVVCIVFCLIGMKRGAIIIASVCTVYFILMRFRGEKASQRFLLLLISLIVIVVLFNYVVQISNENLLFQYQLERTMEGDSSSRDFLYSSLIKYYTEDASPLQQLFGSGANATLRYSFNFAHNDWLEILINQGAFGVIVYAVYWITMFKEWRRRKAIPDAYLAIGLFMIIYFMKTLFSMSYSDITYYAMFVFAFYLGSTEKNENTSHYTAIRRRRA